MRQPSKGLGIRTRRDLLPGAAPAPSVPLREDLEALHEAREVIDPGPENERIDDDVEHE